MITKKIDQMTIEASKKMGEGALKKAMEIKVPVVFSVVDNGGNLLYLEISFRVSSSFILHVDMTYTKI